MHYFHYTGNRLCCEGVAVQTLARKFGTPLYVYSQRTLEEHFKDLDQALAGVEHLVCFAVKSNSNLSVLRALAGLGSGFDIVSGGELRRVIAAGGDPRQCAFAGVGKTEGEIEYALRQGVYTFNAESEPELERINRVAARLKKQAPVAVRVNPDVEAHTHKKITTGTYENKFGIPMERAEALYEAASRLPWVKPVGVQMHIGSQITTVAPFARAVRKILPLVRSLRDRFHIRYFSIGGGIGIVYRPALESGPPSWWKPSAIRRSGRAALPLTIDLYARTLLPLLRPLGMQILLEPGRFIVGNAGVLVTRVEYLKHTGHKNFVIVDAAMNDLIRPAFYDSWHEIVPLRERATEGGMVADVVGPICESGDFLAKNRSLPALREGDFLALMSAGAYGFTMASNYNSRPRPAEVLVSGKSSRLVRRRERLADLIHGERR